MGIGAAVGAGALAIAIDLDLAAFGIAVLAIVIVGLIVLLNFGGESVQKHVRGLFTTIFWGFVLTGGAQLIARGAQRVFVLSGG